MLPGGFFPCSFPGLGWAYWPGSSFLPFLKTGVQSSGTFPSHSHLSKRESGLAVTSASSFSTCGHNLSQPVDLCVSSLFKCSLMWSSSTEVQAANDKIHRLQEREHEERKLQADKLMAREEKRVAHWEELMKEQQNKQAEVDEEHRKAVERLKEQYSEMEKELAKYVSF
ncbi:biogenesis of lysosome-related organelles complex 1 subunit 5 isoform X2 [Rissa tridactyla]|uniref:biogenesis of lysosome-related organelles complex 1 subunit 5 isoform X2 n=1 Tax=Rissa tridactyla TaxID=75485 RepID=UPI0023BA5F35|nr:biogenesis of lysosome-related organelles complex 1 subunit 5 isoform X2 [Rissa tridactyla]